MAYPASSVKLVLHGSKDPRYLRAVEDFARALGLEYSFSCPGKGLGAPLYVARGADYERAEASCSSGVPPLIEWSGFAEFINSMDADLVVLHGTPTPPPLNGLRSNVAFIERGDPLLSNYVKEKCPTRVLLLLLAPGVIMDKALNELKRCSGIELLGPLMELDEFRMYFRSIWPKLVAALPGKT